ncbi:MAG TPA: hypothetical protein VGQ77_05580 [Methylomirabilota bacterium]|jgi:hypothetical protein|nr:hypothetical protein [Methylomirabilota bacterium]
MAEEWEILTLRGLTATDERAEEFTGTLVIHKAGSNEPVENVTVRIRRSIVREMQESLGRLLARSTGFVRDRR